MQTPEGVLDRAFIGSEVLEAVSNYPLADEPLHKSSRQTPFAERPPIRDESEGRLNVQTDSDLWERVFRACGETSKKWSGSVHIECAAISEWVARVPGLYWRKGSSSLRKSRPSDIESQLDGWTTYNLPFKSMMVSGGVGTLRLPPANDGFRLATLTATFNASAGVPTLIAPDVWDELRLSEGTLMGGITRWRDMPLQWAAQFPIVSGVPRGCLVFDDAASLRVKASSPAPVMVHPFSVMEYWDGPTLLHDFVFATAETKYGNFRRDLERFFDEYRKAKGRDGIYLFAADVANPMWGSTFASPSEMRERRGSEMGLIEARIKDEMNGANTTDALLRRLSKLEADDLKRLSVDSGIDAQRWFQGGRVADEAIRLIDAAIGSNKLPALLYAVQSQIRP